MMIFHCYVVYCGGIILYIYLAPQKKSWDTQVAITAINSRDLACMLRGTVQLQITTARDLRSRGSQWGWCVLERESLSFSPEGYWYTHIYIYTVYTHYTRYFLQYLGVACKHLLMMFILTLEKTSWNTNQRDLLSTICLLHVKLFLRIRVPWRLTCSIRRGPSIRSVGWPVCRKLLFWRGPFEVLCKSSRKPAVEGNPSIIHGNEFQCTLLATTTPCNSMF